jgi:hypothetical protein
LARKIVALAVVALGFVACGWDWTVVPKADASDAGEGGAADVVMGPEAGQKSPCRSNDQCVPEEVCIFEDFRCGAGVEGTCVQPTPEVDCLSGDPSPACGCNGQVAKNRCLVQPNRTDLWADGKCAPPENRFRCGFVFCESKTEFCLESRTPDYNDFVCIRWQCAERSCKPELCPETKNKCEIATCSVDSDGETLVVCTKLEDK